LCALQAKLLVISVFPKGYLEETIVVEVNEKLGLGICFVGL